MCEPLVLCLLAFILVCCAAWGADGPQPVHVWHFDEPAGDALLDAGPADPTGDDFVDLQLLGGAQRVEGRFGGAVQTGDGGYVQGEGIGRMASGAVELWVQPLEEVGGAQFGFIGFGNRFGENNDRALLGIFPGAAAGDPVRFGFGICPGTWSGAGSVMSNKNV